MSQLSEIYGKTEVMAEFRSSQGPLKLAIGAVYLTAMATIACAVTQWTTTQKLVEKTSKLAAEQRSFNDALVVSLSQLSERAGWMTSADLAPVRFRFRCIDGVSLPVGDISGHLSRVNPETNQKSNLYSLHSRNGIIDFGLLSPGRYELAMETAEGMTSRHGFDLLPGVAIDRCVICPHRFDTSLTDSRATVKLDSECSLEGGVVLLKVAPALFSHGGWTWTPPDSWPEVIVAASTDGQRLPLETADRWPQLVAAASNGNPMFLETGSDLLTIPYRYCEVREMVCFQRTLTDAGDEELTQLGTIAFTTPDNPNASREEHVNFLNGDMPYRWVSAAKCPQFETRLIELTEVVISCPDGCLQEMLGVANADVPSTFQTAGRRFKVSGL